MVSSLLRSFFSSEAHSSQPTIAVDKAELYRRLGKEYSTSTSLSKLAGSLTI